MEIFKNESSLDRRLLEDSWRRLMKGEKIASGKYYANKLMKALIEGGFQFSAVWRAEYGNYALEVA